MEIKPHRELRAKPKIIGLAFQELVVFMLVIMVCIMFLLLSTTIIVMTVVAIIVSVAYYFCLKSSSKNIYTKIAASPDINFYTDTLNARL